MMICCLCFLKIAKDDALTLERELLGFLTKSFRLSFTNGDSPLKIWIFVGDKIKNKFVAFSCCPPDYINYGLYIIYYILLMIYYILLTDAKNLSIAIGASLIPFV